MHHGNLCGARVYSRAPRVSFAEASVRFPWCTEPFFKSPILFCLLFTFAAGWTLGGGRY
jgi:hypothetical protein